MYLSYGPLLMKKYKSKKKADFVQDLKKIFNNECISTGTLNNFVSYFYDI